jgi:hypothetical protein
MESRSETGGTYIMSSDNRVVLQIDSVKLLMSAKTAFLIFEALTNEEELLLVRNEYKKDAVSQQWGTIKKFEPMGDSEKCSINYMPPAEYMLRYANTDKDT